MKATDMFECGRLSGTLSYGTCVLRQRQKGLGPAGDYPECRECAYGKAVAAAIGHEVLSPPRRTFAEGTYVHVPKRRKRRKVSIEDGITRPGDIAHLAEGDPVPPRLSPAEQRIAAMLETSGLGERIAGELGRCAEALRKSRR